MRNFTICTFIFGIVHYVFRKVGMIFGKAVRRGGNFKKKIRKLGFLEFGDLGADTIAKLHYLYAFWGNVILGGSVIIRVLRPVSSKHE